MSALDELGYAIAAGDGEQTLFAEALGLLPSDARARRLCASGAYADAAILLHRTALPGRGFQFGEMPAGRGLAKSWAKGDVHALPFEAASPALSLLRATVYAFARARERAVADACGTCGGLGWTLARDGDKRICRHGR